MADENKIIDLDTLSHFKAKQDLENERKFKKKDDATDLKGAVRYDAAQALTEQEKAQARLNLGISENGGGGGGSVEGAVRYDVKQTLTDEQKAKARENIGADDFDNLKFAPFGYVKKNRYAWDGNTEGRVTTSVMIAELGLEGMFCKVGEAPEGDISLNRIVWNNFGEHTEFIEALVQRTEGNKGFIKYWKTMSPAGDDIVEIPVVAVINEPCVIEEIQFSETGVYFIFADSKVLGMEKPAFVQEIFDYNNINEIPDDLLPSKVVKTDENGVIPARYLPSFVDDVIEGWYDEENNQFWEPIGGDSRGVVIPESGKIYIDRDTGKSYRWGGSIFVEMNPPEITFATDADIDALFT